MKTGDDDLLNMISSLSPDELEDLVESLPLPVAESR